MAFFKELIVRITGDTTDLRKETTKAQGIVSGFSNELKGLGAGVAAAFSVKAVIDFGKASVQAYDVAAKSQAKLLSALGGQVDVQRRLLAQSTLLQSGSLFDDESIQGAQMFLATMKLTESQITRILPLIMDFATKTGSDLVSAANVVAKSIGSSNNALGRYGIEIEGAAGSSERFEMALAGLNKQVGGLSKAAAEAGTSSLVQLRNTIDDLKESIGKIIAGPIQKFVSNLKDMIELRTGVAEQNWATKWEGEGRAIASQAKTTDEARAKLYDYLQVRKKVGEELTKHLNENIAESKKLGNQLAIGGHGYWETMVKEAQAAVNGNNEAIKAITATMGSEVEMQKLIAKGNVTVADTTKAVTTEVGALVEQYKMLDGWTSQMGFTGPILPGEELSGARDPGTLTPVLPKSFAPTPTMQPSNVTPDMLNALSKKAEDANALNNELERTAPLIETITNAMVDMGYELSQGADNWTDFGKMALNALKQVVAGLIAKGIAGAVSKALTELPPGVGLAVGALTGGLAAGIFSTALNQIPSFASGGFVSSPTLAMVGDNPSGRGEYIVPAEKMGGGGRLYTEVSGRDLRIILDRENQFQGRV